MNNAKNTAVETKTTAPQPDSRETHKDIDTVIREKAAEVIRERVTTLDLELGKAVVKFCNGVEPWGSTPLSSIKDIASTECYGKDGTLKPGITNRELSCYWAMKYLLSFLDNGEIDTDWLVKVETERLAEELVENMVNARGRTINEDGTNIPY